MNPNDVVETFVADVMRRLPRQDRNDVGLELRGLLVEMLADRAAVAGRAADDAMVLAMLREFGTPIDVAARYRAPGIVIIPAEETRTFALLSIVGVGLQWAVTLPRVFQGQPVVAWWFSWGLGSLWWPGFLVMMALAAHGVRELGLRPHAWRPRSVDRECVNRMALAFGIAGGIIGAALVTSLPLIVGHLPGPFPQVFAFDAEFLRTRAWPVLVLWLAAFVNIGIVFHQGRWAPTTRKLEIAINLAFVALFAWWLAGGSMFRAHATDAGARAGIALVTACIVLDLLFKLHRQWLAIHPPKAGA